MTVEDDALPPAAAAKCKRPASFHGLPDTEASMVARRRIGADDANGDPLTGAATSGVCRSSPI